MTSNNYGVPFEANITEWLEAWDWSRGYRLFSQPEEMPIPDLPEVEEARPVLGSWMKDFLVSHRMEEMTAVDWGNGVRGLCVYDERHSQRHYIVVCAVAR